jgi:hypothetical protein
VYTKKKVRKKNEKSVSFNSFFNTQQFVSLL